MKQKQIHLYKIIKLIIFSPVHEDALDCRGNSTISFYVRPLKRRPAPVRQSLTNRR